MLQFGEYKVKLNNLRPELDELDQALGLETAIRAQIVELYLVFIKQKHVKPHSFP